MRGICRYPECPKAASGERIELYAGPGQYCPECGKTLEPIAPDQSPSLDGRALMAENLRKRYGARDVVDGVSVRVAPGEIVGLLGPNGAGKTTTFGMIVGNVKANEGAVRVNGTDITRLSM